MQKRLRAVAEPGRGEARSLGIIPNELGAIRRLIQKLGRKNLRACYEAGPTGFALYWQLVELGVECEVIAPTLVPRSAGDRIKTDRRDALKLARCYRAGDLTPVWVPDQGHEALRDLVRAREAAKYDQHRARQRLSKFLLRTGKKPPEGSTWSLKSIEWIRTLRYDHVAQEATKVDYLAEVDHALSATTNEIALKAQHRLHRRYIALMARGKPSPKVLGAIGRELLGFIWAIAVQVESEHRAKAQPKKLAA